MLTNKPVAWLRVTTWYKSYAVVFEANLTAFLEASTCITFSEPMPVVESTNLTRNLSSNTAVPKRYFGHASREIVPTFLYTVVPPPAWTTPLEVSEAPPTSGVDVVIAARKLADMALL